MACALRGNCRVRFEHKQQRKAAPGQAATTRFKEMEVACWLSTLRAYVQCVREFLNLFVTPSIRGIQATARAWRDDEIK